MPERKRSKDGVSETERFIEETDAAAHQGRASGELARKVGTRDESKRGTSDGGATRVTKSDEKGDGNLGGHHGTGSEDQ